MKKLFAIGLLGMILLNACKSEPENTVEDDNVEVPAAAPAQKDIEVLFNEKSFADPKMVDLLHELNICDPKQKDLTDYNDPACIPEFFKFFPFIENVPVQNAFLLLVKSRVHGYNVRRLFVFQREAGQLVQVNRFIANLIGTRKSASKHDDLVLRFFDQDANSFNCVYTWQGNKYAMKAVEQINDANVKADFQDSMNVEINKVLIDNQLAI
jgi:hypothetical protein